MLKGIYSAASGMMAIEHQKSVLANNMANVNTTGFKEDKGVIEAFPQMLINRIDRRGVRPLGVMGTGSQYAYNYINFLDGPIRKTENPLDLALVGPGFFVVETPEGIRYTRDGNFTLNGDRQLVDFNGNYILGEEGPITLDVENFLFDAAGYLRSNGENLDRIQLVAFPEPGALRKVGSNYYEPVVEAGEPFFPEETQVMAGFLEGSNVNIINTMTEMIAAVRLYETQMKAVQAQDETLEKTVNQVGNV